MAQNIFEKKTKLNEFLFGSGKYTPNTIKNLLKCFKDEYEYGNEYSISTDTMSKLVIIREFVVHKKSIGNDFEKKKEIKEKYKDIMNVMAHFIGNEYHKMNELYHRLDCINCEDLNSKLLVIIEECKESLTQKEITLLCNSEFCRVIYKLLEHRSVYYDESEYNDYERGCLSKTIHFIKEYNYPMKIALLDY